MSDTEDDFDELVADAEEHEQFSRGGPDEQYDEEEAAAEEERAAKRARTFGNVPLSQQFPSGGAKPPGSPQPASQPDPNAPSAAPSPFDANACAGCDDADYAGYSSPKRLADAASTAAPTLDQSQQRAFDIAMGGSNLFLTGGPGTGKSFTLKLIIKALKEKHGDDAVLVAAPTGVAALIAEGQTLHTKPGPGVPKGTTEAFGNMKSKSSLEFWRCVRALVIDEISMVDAEFLDWYMNSVPDVQLLFCGDYEQLPPVPDKQGSLNNEEHLHNCVAAARRKDNNEGRDKAGRADPAVDDPNLTNGGWLDMSKNTPFGMRETTGK